MPADTERASRPGRGLLLWGLGLAIATTLALAIVLWFVIDNLNHAFRAISVVVAGLPSASALEALAPAAAG